MQAYDEECNDHNRQIIEQVTAKVGNKALADFKKLLDFAAVTTKLEIVSKPDGDNQNETCGVFTEVWIDQWAGLFFFLFQLCRNFNTRTNKINFERWII